MRRYTIDLTPRQAGILEEAVFALKQKGDRQASVARLVRQAVDRAYGQTISEEPA
jgi:hypothetical protein